MKSTKRVLVVVSLAGIIATTACTLAPTFPPILAVTEVSSEIKTSTSVITPTPEDTATPTETATPSQDQIIDGRISDFLNGRGDFSDEALKNKIFLSSDHELYPNEQITDDLGVISVTTKNNISTASSAAGIIPLSKIRGDKNGNISASAQGILLGSELQRDKVIIIVGTKNYEGKRIVIPFYDDELMFKIGGIDLYFYKNGRHLGYDAFERQTFDNMEDFNNLLNKNISNPIGFSLLFDSVLMPEAGFDKALLAQALKDGYTTEDVHSEFLSEIDNIPVQQNLFPELHKCNKSWDSADADMSKDVTIINSMADIKDGIDPSKVVQLGVGFIIGNE